jgi:hopanoid biosynthesis associated RND transporter like protein HpnN
MEDDVQQPEVDQPRQKVARAVGAWVATVSARPVWALGLLFLVVMLALVAALRLSVDTDSRRMLSPDLPFQQRANALNDAFPALKNTLVVVVRSPSSDAADAVVAELTEALTQRNDIIDWVFTPTADRYLVSHGLLYLDRDALDTRLAQLGKSANLLAGLRVDQSFDGFLRALAMATELAGQVGERRAGGDSADLEPLYAEAAAVLSGEADGDARPFGWSTALAGSGTGPVLRLITAGPKLDFTRVNPAKPALAAIREAIADLDPVLVQRVEIGVTGELALRAEELQSVTRRIGLSFAFSLIFVVILLRLALGTMARTGLAFGALVATLILTAGFASLAVGALNLISIAFIVLMVGLGIDFAIHIISHFDEHAGECLDRHQNRRIALIRSSEAIGVALILSAATTSLAFFAFATTDFTGMAQLGLIGGAGVLIALAVALTAIPAAISLWPRLAAGPPPRRLWQPPRVLRRGLIWVALGIGLAGTVLAPQSRFDSDPMNLRDPAAHSVQTWGWLAANPDMAPLRLSLLAANPDEARAMATTLKAVPEVRDAHWLGDLVPDDQVAKLDLIDLSYLSLLHAVEGAPANLTGTDTPVTPETLALLLETRPGLAATALARQLHAYVDRRTPARDAALAGEIFRYFPLLIDRLRLQLDAGEVTAEALPAPLRTRYVAPDGQLRVEISAAADLRDPAAMAAFTEAVAAVAPGAAGPPDQITGAAGSVAGAILQATILALLGCVLLAWVMLRDMVRITAILLPLLLAGGVTVGASVLFDLPFNYANVIVLPLLIGVGIDSGVHFALRANHGPGSVFDTATPRVVLYSALTTIAAFATLGLSEHRGTASMGILLAISLAAAVGMIFALTPALVRLARQRGGKKITPP